MRVIPVMDVRGGRPVAATGGDRDRYRPLETPLAPGGDPVELARAYRDRLGLRDCYLADLDALAGREPDLDLVGRLSREGLRVWVDAGIRDAPQATRILEAGAARAIVGLETLPGREPLEAIGATRPSGRLAFSLDVRDGRPLATAPDFRRSDPAAVAGLARHAGFATQILLELSRVGSLAGPPWDLLRAVRNRHGDLFLIAGGGVRHAEDLHRLARLGVAGALVATALHRGRITRGDLEAVTGRCPGAPGSAPPDRRTPPPPR